MKNNMMYYKILREVENIEKRWELAHELLKLEPENKEAKEIITGIRRIKSWEIELAYNVYFSEEYRMQTPKWDLTLDPKQYVRYQVQFIRHNKFIETEKEEIVYF